MCLRKLVKVNTRKPEFKIPRDEKGYYAWKCFRSIRQNFVYPLFFGTKQPVDKWIHEKDYRCMEGKDRILSPRGVYEAGFHLYLRKNLSSETICRKVYLKGVVAKGYQDGRECVVCKKIFIPRQRQR